MSLACRARLARYVPAMSKQREPVRFLVFAASLRAGSLNTTLAKLAASVIERHGGSVDLTGMSALDGPAYSQDAQTRDGFPPGAAELRRRLDANDGFVIASPEYNGSMPGLLKNLIDWVSRFRPQPFNGKHALLLSASPSMAGGNRGLWALSGLVCAFVSCCFALAAWSAALSASRTS